MVKKTGYKETQYYIDRREKDVHVGHVLSTIFIMGIALEEMQRLQAHSAESSVVSRSYATLLIPVHSLEKGSKVTQLYWRFVNVCGTTDHSSH